MFEVATNWDSSAAVELDPAVDASSAVPLSWTVLVPFFNERDFLEQTLASLAGQSRSFALILIDNGSTDGSAQVATSLCRRLGLTYRLIEERRPGKVSALAAGLALVRTPFVATCDADTWYPAGYLAEAQSLLERDGCVVAGAYFTEMGAGGMRRYLVAAHKRAAARVFPGQCHTGGAGQCFETAVLRRAGGFDPRRWNYVLEDHEIVHQMLKHGKMAYNVNLWCVPSRRERDRDSTGWTTSEQVTYHATVGRTGDWFFASFLGPRLAARKLSSERLRERPHQRQEHWHDMSPYPVR